ncbi:5'-nucleotidase domain-containing protein DDB_G0275467-like [Papaver somniferum]|uniref:5'-nucleotidase domain-containing protein DDB_G0275467-like n=1 Tax=Papaver somniferum TaxID=3469 RepID=UPI000E6F94E8|nr:5'-nucleotidase domain-containing protein DDB_G0275467-like [Papaver somniferum]
MWAASCLASCCAASACEACRTVISSISGRFARIAYCGLFAFSLTISWILREVAVPLVEKIPYSRYEWFETDDVLRLVPAGDFYVFLPNGIVAFYGIYVNKNLGLDNTQVYGSDYDYTLAHYLANLQSLIYDLAKDHIVNEFKYREICSTFEYDPSFSIRGLYYDKLKGCLLKLDFFGLIEPDACFFGRRKLSRKEIEEMYGPRHIGQACGLVQLMDFFCFSEHFVDATLQFDASYIYEDVNRAIQHVHPSGLVHRGILSDPQRYVVKNMLHFLKMLKEKGKKLFLMTNSPYYFVDGGMRSMLEVPSNLFKDLRV